MKNNSPWLHQLNKERLPVKLDKDAKTDVTIVGGGIAGISTAFFVLNNTDKKVILVEGNKIGHGATGYNAGQLVSYFARNFKSITEEFGLELTAQAHRAIEEEAWKLLDTIYTEAGLDIPLSRFSGHLGMTSQDHLQALLEDNVLRIKAGLLPKEILIADHVDFLPKFQTDFDGLFKVVSHQEILDRLETKESEFIACLSEQKGVMNSALFAELVAEYLTKKFKDRFDIYEHTHVAKVVLHDASAILDVMDHTIESECVVLCTNGFDGFTIFDKTGLEIDTRFHHELHGVVGYMSGYLEEPLKPPIAISYFYEALTGDKASGTPYIYLSRRPYEYKSDKSNLISLGGPDISLEDRSEYEKEHEYPDWAKDELDKFVRAVYETDPGKNIEYIFTWHGLMGYTTNKLRLIGREPLNPTLLYNLGCNGAGLLPSIYGGERISKIIKGEDVGASIFDPRRKD